MPTMEDIKSWPGHDARGSHGDTLGKIEDIYLGRETGEPEWAAVETALFGGDVSFEPLAAARRDSGAVARGLRQGRGQGRPRADADGRFSAVAESDMSGNGPTSMGPAGGRGTRGCGF
jgi:hypothetical protein